MKRLLLSLSLLVFLAPNVHAAFGSGAFGDLDIVGSASIGDLEDINSATATAGNLLVANGTNWDSVDVMTVDNNTGNVGIRRSSPEGKLVVDSSSTLGVIDSTWVTSGEENIGLLGEDTVLSLVSTDGLSWGSALSWSQVDVSEASDFENAWSIIRQTNGNGTGDGSLRFLYGTDSTITNNSDVMTLASGGNVGIGTTSPSGNLDVVVSSTSALTVNSSGEVQGDALADQQSYELAGHFLDVLTAPKLLLGWITPATTEVDLSGQGHDATYNGTMTTGDQLNKGLVWSLDFDGTDDYLNVSDHADFTFDDSGSNPVSMGGWIEVTAGSTVETIISKWDETTASEAREWRLSYDSTEKVLFEAYDESANIEVSRVQDSAMSAGWRFIVITYDSTGGATAMNGLTIYVDGVLAASTATNNGSYVAMEDLGHDVWIGSTESTAGSAELLFSNDMGVVFVTAEELSATDVHKLWIKTRGYFNE